MMKPEKIEKEFICIVEGFDDKYFFDKILKILDMDFQIFQTGGKDNIPQFIQSLPKIPGFNNVKKIIFVRDADDSYTSAFDSVNQSLIREKLVTDKKNKKSLIKEKNYLIGIYIFPNNKDNGSIEDLFVNTFDKKLMKCIDNYIDCSNPEHKKISKLKILCYLAYKDPTANNLGIAVLRNHFDLNHRNFDEFKDFLLKFKKFDYSN